MVNTMADSPTNFSVRFGAVGRTLDYDDSQGQILFTFDAGSRGPKSICLEHHAPKKPRPPHYEIAFQRTKQYLESCGYEVETFGE
jgi:hypothetical protein